MNLLDSKPATEPQLRRIAVAIQELCLSEFPGEKAPELGEIVKTLGAFDKLRIAILQA